MRHFLKLIALVLACVALLDAGSNLLSQEPDENVDHSEELLELFAERRELEHALESLDREQRKVRQHFEALEKIIEIRRELDDVIAKREESPDESDESEELDRTIDALEEKIEVTRTAWELSLIHI